MLDERMEKALNEQVNAEMYSAYLYLAMSADFETKNLPGFAGWMKAQAQEEMMHAMKLYNFIIDRGGKANLLPIDGPQQTWESPSAAYGAALKHEEYITGRINDLYTLANDIRDQATRVFLHWFIDEQVEEEKTAGEWYQKVKMVEQAPGGLYLVDREAAQRVVNLVALAAAIGGGE